ncbi:MAG: hypothetical protein HQM10_25140 [Candidatus Riflebacteria bacterium]|nr:hypothetical protein [Candidatus Riflebacteria bacterium]
MKKTLISNQKIIWIALLLVLSTFGTSVAKELNGKIELQPYEIQFRLLDMKKCFQPGSLSFSSVARITVEVTRMTKIVESSVLKEYGFSLEDTKSFDNCTWHEFLNSNHKELDILLDRAHETSIKSKEQSGKGFIRKLTEVYQSFQEKKEIIGTATIVGEFDCDSDSISPQAAFLINLKKLDVVLH